MRKKSDFKGNKSARLVFSSVAVLALLGGAVGLNAVVEKSSQTSQLKTNQKQSRLDIALVNEDQAVSMDGKNYNLGSDYVKNIERDENHNWSVVSRGTAESGLSSGKYQLIIYIPSNFSSKILDTENIDLDQATITYKVNSDGNAQIEKEATETGMKAVSDLNGQLVNMYMASILGNLYTAQQNAQKVEKTQTNNVSTYKNSIYGSATTLPNSFPSLVMTADGALQANQSLIELLQSNSQNVSSSNVDPTATQANLQQLMTSYSSGETNRADMMSQMMSSSNLADQVATMIGTLKQQQETLNSQVNVTPPSTNGDTSNSTNKSSSNYETLSKNFDTQLADLEKQLSSFTTPTGNKKSISDIVNETLRDYYGKDINNLSSITVKDMLSGSGAGLSYPIADYTASLDGMVRSAVSKLPADSYASLNLSALPGTNYADRISGYSSASAYGFGSDIGTSGNLSGSLTDAANTLAGFDTKTLTASSSGGKQTAKLSYSGVSIDSWYVETDGVAQAPVSPSTGIEIDTSKTNVFHFNITTTSSESSSSASASQSSPSTPNNSTVPETPGTPATGDTETSPSTPSSTATVSPTVMPMTNTTTNTNTNTSTKGNISVSLSNGATSDSNFSLEDYQKAVANYSAAAQAVVDAYNNAGSLLSQYFPDGAGSSSVSDKFLNQSAYSLLVSIMTDAVTNATTQYDKNASYNQELTNLKNSKDELMSNYSDVAKTNSELETSISDTLTKVTELQTQLSSANAGGNTGGGSSTTTSDANSASGSGDSSSSGAGDWGSLSSDLSSLMATSEMAKATSSSNVAAAESVNSILSNFKSAADGAKEQSEQLSSGAQALMTEFTTELKQSNDFVGSFVTVLDNAYENGVPNETLLEFLSNPLTTKTSSVRAAINSYRPFTWILLLETVSLFAAYLFATQDLVRRLRDKYKKHFFENADLFNVANLSALSIVSGLVMGIASSRALHVASDLQPSWVSLVVLFAFLLTQSQYFLLKHMKAIGMGLSLYTIVSYVYFSSAIGGTASFVGWLKTVKDWNILSYLENLLSAYLDNTGAALSVFFIVFIAVITFIIANILVVLPWEKGKLETED